MRQRLCFLLTLLAVCHCDLGLAVGKRLKVTVTGADIPVGFLQIRLDGGEEAYYNKSQPVDEKSIKVSAPLVKIEFENIPPGRYALKIFHDLNSDHTFNTNFLGIPSEKYGISNKCRSRSIRLPSFTDASFEVNEASDLHTIAIQLDYHSML